jgi:hypothetical protein
VGHKTPLIARLDDVAQAIERSPQRVLPLHRVLGTEPDTALQNSILIAYVIRIPGLLRPDSSIFGTKKPFEK